MRRIQVVALAFTKQCVYCYAPNKLVGGQEDLHFSVRPSVCPSVRTSRNILCATPPTSLDEFDMKSNMQRFK